MTGDDSATFPTDWGSCTPGTYVVELAVGGNRKLINPLVIAGYNVQLDVADTAEQAETITATSPLRKPNSIVNPRPPKSHSGVGTERSVVSP
jgi:hypothetical protein